MVADNIARYVELKGIKQNVLASAIGIKPQSMSKTLMGERTLSADEYRDICLFLEVPFDKFMSEEMAS